MLKSHCFASAFAIIADSVRLLYTWMVIDCMNEVKQFKVRPGATTYFGLLDPPHLLNDTVLTLFLSSFCSKAFVLDVKHIAWLLHWGKSSIQIASTRSS